MREVFNFRWDCTCGACPEQYDIYLNGKKVAYFRLRWGVIRLCAYDEVGSIEKEIDALNYGDGSSCGALKVEDEDFIKGLMEVKILEYLIEQRRKELKDEGK